MSPVRAWKWKWSNGVEKSETDLFWCISMTNNVKSCKKMNNLIVALLPVLWVDFWGYQPVSWIDFWGYLPVLWIDKHSYQWPDSPTAVVCTIPTIEGVKHTKHNERKHKMTKWTFGPTCIYLNNSIHTNTQIHVNIGCLTCIYPYKHKYKWALIDRGQIWWFPDGWLGGWLVRFDGWP